MIDQSKPISDAGVWTSILKSWKKGDSDMGSTLFEKHPLPWTYNAEEEEIEDSSNPTQWVLKLRRMHMEYSSEAIIALIDSLNKTHS